MNKPQLLNAFLFTTTNQGDLGSVERPVLLRWMRPVTLALWILIFCGQLIATISSGSEGNWLLLLATTALFAGVHIQFWYEESDQGLRFKRTLNRMRGRMYEDDLTGLPNSRHFVSELRRQMMRSVRSGRGFSLVLTDVGGLEKDVAEEARMLPALSRTMRQSVGEADFVARLQGLVFAAIIVDDRSQSTAQKTEALLQGIGSCIRPDQAGLVYPVVSLTGYEGEVEVRDFLRRAQRDLLTSRSHVASVTSRARPLEARAS